MLTRVLRNVLCNDGHLDRVGLLANVFEYFQRRRALVFEEFLEYFTLTNFHRLHLLRVVLVPFLSLLSNFRRLI